MGPITMPVPARKPQHLKRLAAGVLPLVLLASVGLAGRAEAAVPTVACGTTLTVDTKLTRNLYCSSGDGLTLGPNVHLNLGGHKLVGPGVGASGTGITSIAGDASVRNGEVRNWTTGLALGDDGTVPGAGPRVTDVVLRNARSSFQSLSTFTVTRVVAIDSPIESYQGDLRVVKSEFIRSSILVAGQSSSIVRSRLVASTLTVFGTYAHLTIDRSRLDGRGTTHLAYLAEGGLTLTNSTVKNYKGPISGYWSSATILNSTFTDMPQGVLGDVSYIFGTGGSIIKGNSFTRSGVVLNPRTPMTVENNVFRNNTEGAVFDGSVPPDWEMWAPGRAANNIFVGNSSNGIRSEIPGLEVGHNTAKRNGGYGIYAPQAVDLGKNVAYKNKLGQCVGVVCSARR